mmetsp:Transcript_396/g.945  ORF Transcript_396/g.945 Transcript_396/m.945 type:complete len:236 (+) Transcript_396:966-1673(+)
MSWTACTRFPLALAMSPTTKVSGKPCKKAGRLLHTPLRNASTAGSCASCVSSIVLSCKQLSRSMTAFRSAFRRALDEISSRSLMARAAPKTASRAAMMRLSIIGSLSFGTAGSSTEFTKDSMIGAITGCSWSGAVAALAGGGTSPRSMAAARSSFSASFLAFAAAKKALAASFFCAAFRALASSSSSVLTPSSSFGLFAIGSLATNRRLVPCIMGWCVCPRGALPSLLRAPRHLE